MIDIVILTKNFSKESIERCLISICLQSIKEKLAVYILNTNTSVNYSKEINLFKDKLTICEVRATSINSIEYLYKIVQQSKNSYITFIDSNDIFYNYLSLEYLYTLLIDEKIDICYGLVAEENNGIYHYSNENNYNYYGKIFSKKYFFNSNTNRCLENFSVEINYEENTLIKHIDELVYLHRI